MLIMFRAVQLFWVVSTSFLFLSNIPFSSSSQHSPPFPTHHTSSAELKSGRRVVELMVNRGRRERFLGGGGGDSEEQLNSSLLVLAAKTTYRKDPLNHFHKYTGGWNISNPHYWASVAYTAVPFFFIGAIWFVVFGISLTLICLCFCCCRKEPYGYSRIAYALSLILLTLFTIAAIVGCVVLYTGQGKYHSSSMSTLEYVVEQADTTSENLRNVSQYLAAAKQINVDQVFLPSNVQSDIDLIQNKINSSANILSSQTQDNSHKIKNVIESVRLALIVLSAVMLLLTFLGFVFSIFGMQFLVYLLVIAGWILVTATCWNYFNNYVGSHM